MSQDTLLHVPTLAVSAPQFEKIVEKVDIDEIGIKGKIKEEVTRFKKFQQVVLGIRDAVAVDEIDIRNYAKYLLREGTDIEKRELLGCLRGKIELKEKVIAIAVH